MTARLPDGFVHQTLGRGLKLAAARGRDRTALIEGPRRLSYGQLADRMQAIATLAIDRFALRVGDIVAVAAPNCIEYPEMVCGLSEAGAVVATLNPRLTSRELAAILDDCRPKALLAHPSCREAIDAAQARKLPLLVLGESYEAALGEVNRFAVLPDVAEWQSFAMSYTSGTTGTPKGVLLSHRSRMLTFAAMAAEYGCFGPDDHFLALAPMYHGAGFVFSVAPLMSGGQCTVLSHFDPAGLADTLASGVHSGVFMVPTHFHRLLDLPAPALARCRDGHRLRTIISNAAALPQSAKEGVIDKIGDGLLHETYGSTEAGIVTNIRPADLVRKPGSVGTPFLGMEIELRREDGSEADAGEIGELFCRGPYTFNGYWQRPRETAETLVDGWVTVGDMAVRDAEGFLTIVDRKKDMVITGGVNVYPKEIETVIAAVPGVREAAIVGLPDPEWGERLHAYVVPSATNAADADSIIAACRAELAGFKVPRGVTFLSELPRNASGKLLKRELRDRAISA